MESFTPNLGGSQFQPCAAEAGQYGVSVQTGSPSYRYHFTAPPGRLGVEPEVALVYSPGARRVAEGWILDVPRIDRITGEGTSNSIIPLRHLQPGVLLANAQKPTPSELGD